jgi:hypothetical protein
MNGSKTALLVPSLFFLVLFFLNFFFLVQGAAADTIYLKNGRTISAEKVWVEGDQVHYTKFGAVVKYPADQVARIEKGPAPVEAVPSPEPAPTVSEPMGRADDPPPRREPSAETPGPAADGEGVMESVRSFFTPDPSDTHRRRKGAGDPMTIQSLIKRLEYVSPLTLTGVFAAPPLLVWLMGFFIGQYRAKRNPWRYLYSIFVYLVSVPGILASVLIAYSLFFLRRNLLEVNIFVYYLPILSMIVTLVIIGRKVTWSYLPGVDRLYAVMIALVITFGGILAIQKTRIFIVFFGSIKVLIVIAVVCFIILKWATRKVFGRR